MIQSTREDFTNAPNPIPASPELRASRQRPVAMGEVLMCRCNLGELRLLAIASRPYICFRVGQLASRVKSLQGRVIFRVNDLIKTVRGQQEATTLKYAL